MKRNAIILLLLALLLISELLIIPTLELHLFSFNKNTTVHSDNWILNVNTSITQMNENQSKMNIIYNVTYLKDILFPYRVIGGFGFVIKNQDNSIFWTPYLYAPSLATDTNVFQKKGSDISYYSILFNISNSNFKNQISSHDFVMSVSNSDNLIFEIILNQELANITGDLTINVNPALQIAITPSSWQISGYVQSASSQYSSNNNNSSPAITTTNFGFNSLTLLSGFFLLVIFLIKRRKTAK